MTTHHPHRGATERRLRTRLAKACVGLAAGAALFCAAQTALAAPSFSTPTLDFATPLSGNDFAYLVGDFNQDSLSDLYAIKLTNTGSGAIEVHVLSGAWRLSWQQPHLTPPFQDFLLHIATPLVGNDYDYALTDWDGDHVPDLVAVQRTNTASGYNEVTILSGASNYQQSLVYRAVTPLVGSGYDYVVGDWTRDGRPDVIAISRSPGSIDGHKVTVLSGGGRAPFSFLVLPFHNIAYQGNLPLAGSSFSYAMTDRDGDGTPDLVAVKRPPTSSGFAEVQLLAGGSSFQQVLFTARTPLTSDDYAFAVADANNDSIGDLYAIQYQHTASTMAEVHVLGG